MKGQQAPLRLTARGEAVRENLEILACLVAIAAGIAATFAIFTMIGH